MSVEKVREHLSSMHRNVINTDPRWPFGNTQLHLLVLHSDYHRRASEGEPVPGVIHTHIPQKF